jgi:hypothetical protein
MFRLSGSVCPPAATPSLTVEKPKKYRRSCNIVYPSLSPNESAATAITSLSSREFDQDTGRAKKAAAAGPVFITDRGKPAHVLLGIEEYRRTTGARRGIVDALSMPGLADIEFDPPRRARRFLIMFLLDTNVISEPREAATAEPTPTSSPGCPS